MGFPARDGDLPYGGIEENVVAEDIIFAVMLMIRSVIGVPDDIVFHHYAFAPLVVVEPPAAV